MLSKGGTMKIIHYSDCAVNSEPAYPAGECDCGAVKANKKWWRHLCRNLYIEGIWLWRFFKKYPKALLRLSPYQNGKYYIAR